MRFYQQQRIITSIFLILGLFFMGCASSKANIGTAYIKQKEKISGLIILSADLLLEAKLTKTKNKLPFSDYGSGAIWISEDFPFSTAKQLILWSQDYYSQLRYIAYKKDIESKTKFKLKMKNNSIAIGEPTRIALIAGLKAWKRRDFRRLKKIKTEKEFARFIRSKYNKGLSPEARTWLTL